MQTHGSVYEPPYVSWEAEVQCCPNQSRLPEINFISPQGATAAASAATDARGKGRGGKGKKGDFFFSFFFVWRRVRVDAGYRCGVRCSEGFVERARTHCTHTLHTAHCTDTAHTHCTHTAHTHCTHTAHTRCTHTLHTHTHTRLLTANSKTRKHYPSTVTSMELDEDDLFL
eukprot:2931944-Rhodomonas_salina.1